MIALRVDQPDVQVSSDGGKTFEGVAAPAVARAVDITINPADAKQWAVGTEQGVFLSSNSGGSWRQRETTFGARVAWAAPDALYSAGLDGKVRKSADGGKNWEEVGTIGAGPKDFVARPGRQALRLRPGRQDPPLGGRRQDLDRPRHLSERAHATPTLETWRFIAASTPPILAASVSGASTRSAGSARG